MDSYELKIDLNVLNHLGLNLYSNVPAVLSELIANAWDADSTKVSIDTPHNQIVIADNGCGMLSTDLQDKFLTIGYQRRTDKESDLTLKYKRKVMGRKGIGKLSVFSIAELIQVYTKRDNNLLGIELDIKAIRETINAKETYKPKIIKDVSHEWKEKLPNTGTIIVLKNLKKRILNSLDKHLKTRISRRFDIWNRKNFSVTVNGDNVTIEDRNYFSKLEFVTLYGDYPTDRFNQIGNDLIICRKDNSMNLYGWIGLVRESGALQDNENENLNKISILSRGKVALEDILDSFREGGLYTKYLIGEIRADFLDQTEKEDIALSNRQDFIRDDERIIQLKEFIEKELAFISKERVKYKEEQGAQKAEQIPAIKDWFASLKGDNKKAAKKLFGRINTIATDEEHRKTLYKHGVLAFEHLHHKAKIQQLDNLNIENLEASVQLFSELDDIEASWYYEITQGRLEVINKLRVDVDENALEKIIQKHIYTHLWLLDPSWDRATEVPHMEQTIKQAFANVPSKLSDEERKGRIDIRYKKITGKHVIIELKRPHVSIKDGALSDQLSKYKSALEKVLNDNNEEGTIECICLLGKLPQGWDSANAKLEGERSLAAKNIRVITYQQLIKDAQTMYQQYLEKQKQKGRISKLLEDIDSQNDS